jgi:hypothetical protein
LVSGIAKLLHRKKKEVQNCTWYLLSVSNRLRFYFRLYSFFLSLSCPLEVLLTLAPLEVYKRLHSFFLSLSCPLEVLFMLAFILFITALQGDVTRGAV